MRNIIGESGKSSGRAFWHFSAMAVLCWCGWFDKAIGDYLKAMQIPTPTVPICTEWNNRVGVYYTLTYDATIGSSAHGDCVCGEIIFLVISAKSAGLDTFTEIIDWGEEHIDFLRDCTSTLRH